MWHLPPGLGEQEKVNRLLPSRNSTNWLFSNLPKSSAHASGAWRHSHPLSHILSGIFILTSVNETSSPRARQHLRSILHLTNPCAKQKFLSLTKPKGKIYKKEIARPLYYKSPQTNQETESQFIVDGFIYQSDTSHIFAQTRATLYNDLISYKTYPCLAIFQCSME